MKIFYISKPQIFGFLATLLFFQVSSHIMPEKYEIVRPFHLNPSRHRRDLSTREKGGHLKDTAFSFTAAGRHYMMDISLNSGLLSDQFLIGYQLPDGNLTTTRNYQHCYYHGKLSGKENTTVVLSTCSGLRGTIKDGNGKVFGIEPTTAANDEHMFYNLEDVPKRNLKCGVEGHSHDFNMNDVYSDSHLRFRRSVAAEKKYVSLAFINDKRQFERMGKNLTTASNRAIEIANHVDSMLKTINARGALVYVETWNVMDLAHIYLPASKTLQEIRKYNKDVLVHNLVKKGIKRDNVQLITGIDFEGLVIGMAGIGTICGLSSTGVNMDYTSNAGITAGTVAHELGHNLGFSHDASGCSCGGSPCVMASSGGGVPIGFTTCSKDTFDKRLKEGLGSCLFDVPAKLYGPPVCGNDFLEKGEECDCGSVQECAKSGGSACCNATTCKLHASAQCAVGPCCQNCSYVKQGVVCRKPSSECDLEEACTGISHECPANFYKLDGMSCKNDTAYCFEGGCRTAEDQCDVLWGKQSYKAHKVCFRENMAGTEYSNCGQNELKLYVKCAEKDYMCGTVQCANPPPDGWPIVSSSKSRTRSFYVWENAVSVKIECNQAVITLGPDLDNPTLTASGTKCGDGAICMNHKCTNLTSLDFIKTCPKGLCHNGGICNNMGHCHCPVGFACPDCKEPGPGGSVDSGHKCFTPEAKKGGLTTLAKSLLIVFLGVVPAIAIAMFVLYKFKHALPCTPGSSSSSAGAQAAPSKSAPSKVPDVTYHPQQPSKQPQWLPQHQQQPNQSYSNDNYRSSQVHMNPSPKATPSRPPPAVPSAPSQPTPHPKSPGKAPLPPLRPVASPPGAPKPVKLPPMPPSRP